MGSPRNHADGTSADDHGDPPVNDAAVVTPVSALYVGLTLADALRGPARDAPRPGDGVGVEAT